MEEKKKNHSMLNSNQNPTKPTSHVPSVSTFFLQIKSDPYDQGLPRDVAIRLVTCIGLPTIDDRKKYYRTPHFQKLKKASEQLYGNCAMCGRITDKGRMTVHHRHYGTLFEEHITRDTTYVCQRCHRHHHRK